MKVSEPSEIVESQRPGARNITLPQPRRKGQVSVEEALSRRRSVREFSDQNLSEEQVGQLLWAAQGITDREGLRTAPSAGALYGLEIYVATAKGFDRYLSDSHELERLSCEDLRRPLYRAALEQGSVLAAPAIFVIAAIYSRMARKYGKERGVRYAQLEAGHAAQNLLLEATALGLAGVPVGAFHDDEIKTALSLPVDQSPLYLIPVGR